MSGETIEQSWIGGRGAPRQPALPGLLLVWSGGEPRLDGFGLGQGGLELGRGRIGDVEVDDGRMSRRHAAVRLAGATWILEDLDSRNGSACDGVPFRGELRSDAASVLRCGDSLFLLCRDVAPFLGQRVLLDGGTVIGPTLAEAYRQVDSAAASGETLHVTGETGSGKELAARRFHAAGSRARGPFVAVNCATIPAQLAERVLFGARKGAYSGADQDAEGYARAADGGTLMLDELSEFDLQVQAKLLRMLETREVVPLGATQGKKVSLSVVSATHGSLRERVGDGRFRADLFFRLGRPVVALPALRERREDIPWLVREVLRPLGHAAHASLVEAALLRAWPGNVREAVLELKEAARQAGLAGAQRVEAQHLAAEAGTRGARSQAAPATPAQPEPDAPEPPARSRGPNVEIPAREAIESALAAHGGNVSRAARALGAHRTQLRRWMERYQLAATSDEPDAE